MMYGLFGSKGVKMRRKTWKERKKRKEWREKKELNCIKKWKSRREKNTELVYERKRGEKSDAS